MCPRRCRAYLPSPTANHFAATSSVLLLGARSALAVAYRVPLLLALTWALNAADLQLVDRVELRAEWLGRIRRRLDHAGNVGQCLLNRRVHCRLPALGDTGTDGLGHLGEGVWQFPHLTADLHGA